MNSSVQSHPCFFISKINSKTYVLRSPFCTFSFIFRMKVPDGFRTRNNSLVIGRNQFTYLSTGIPPYVDFL